MSILFGKIVGFCAPTDRIVRHALKDGALFQIPGMHVDPPASAAFSERKIAFMRNSPQMPVC